MGTAEKTYLLGLLMPLPRFRAWPGEKSEESNSRPQNSVWRVNMKGFRYGVVLAVVTASLGFSAQAFSQTSADLPAASSRSTERLKREVRHEILMLPYFDVFDNIAFKIEGYNVTLLGQVTRPSTKKDAERAVRGIEGVENVDNQIEVLPTSPADDRIRLQLYRQIYGYPTLERYAMPVVKPIRIIVKNGHVTLEGVVDNETDKNVAGIQAKSVPGVFDVVNNLRVEKP
jgi:hyperosmotically inducible protein